MTPQTRSKAGTAPSKRRVASSKPDLEQTGTLKSGPSAEVAATAREFYRPLPVSPRLLHLETPESYLRRLLALDHLPASILNHWTRQAQLIAPGSTPEDTILLLARVKGGLSPSSFAHAQAGIPHHCDGTRCPRCVAGIETRYMCRLCARGERVQQYPHMEANVCARHLLWIGPGTTPETQIRTGRNALRADRVYRHLQKTGAVDALRFVELRSIFQRRAEAQGTHYESPEHRDASTYPTIMAVAAAVLSPAHLSTILDPRQSYESAHYRLHVTVAALVRSNADIVTDGLWELLRPAFLTIREQCGENTGSGVADAHSMPIPTLPPATFDHMIRPLEPFRRYLDQLSTCHRDRWRDVNSNLYNWGPLALARADIPSNSSMPAEYICANGHRFKKAPNAIAWALRRGWPGCPFCCNFRALAGYNSLAETQPVLAAEWHPTLNGSVRPSDIMAGGNSAKYWWQCPQGHEYEQSPNNRSKGRNCPYCSRQRVIPGVTSLDITHPALAKEWHPKLNGSLTPAMVLAGSERAVWWLCKVSHPYRARIDQRTRGTKCPYCTNNRVLPGFNDLNTIHPELAREWHRTLNDNLTPHDVLAASTRRVWWQCPLHHEYRARVYNRSSGARTGCPFCSHVRVLPGYNDLETLAPDLASDWDWNRNHGIGPRDIGPGTLRKVWWICPSGHPYEQAVVKHVKGQRCPYCTNRELLPGFNDLQSRFPLLAGEWHPDKNGSLNPSQLLPGNQKLWWLCRAGHDQYETVPNRVKTRGCTRCATEERVLYVPPDT